MVKLFRQMDLYSHTATLGLRFRDVVTGEFVSDGLSVTAYSMANPGNRRPLYPNRSGIFTLHNAPGLRDFEHRGLAEVWQTPLPNKPFKIEVIDSEQRFLPFCLALALPVKGIYTWISPLNGSPGRHENSIPLYSATTRQAPAGMAVIRAEIFDLSRKSPAPWVVLEALSNGRLIARGIADENGRIALLFQYPAPRYTLLSSPLGSPLIGGGRPLFSQSWDLKLSAYYSPVSPLEPDDELPDLHSILSQRSGSLWEDATMTRPLTHVSLQYGRELILRSSEGSLLSPVSPPALPSVLFINPA